MQDSLTVRTENPSGATIAMYAVGAVVAAGAAYALYQATSRGGPDTGSTSPPTIEEQAADLVRNNPGSTVNDLAGMLYTAYWPACPHSLDPNNADHFQCIENWKTAKVFIEEAKGGGGGAPTPTPTPGPSPDADCPPNEQRIIPGPLNSNKQGWGFCDFGTYQDLATWTGSHLKGWIYRTVEGGLPYVSLVPLDGGKTILEIYYGGSPFSYEAARLLSIARDLAATLQGTNYFVRYSILETQNDQSGSVGVRGNFDTNDCSQYMNVHLPLDGAFPALLEDMFTRARLCEQAMK